MGESNPSQQKSLVICIMGPTASGKTALAVDLLDHLDAELISVDSALVYRDMNIGTAKPDAVLLERAPHRLIDIRDPAETYSAADFCEDAQQAIAEIIAAGRVPILVGGTMLYFKALLQGLSPMPPKDEQIRQEIETEAQRHGWAHVHSQLQAVDPESAARIHPNDPQRLQRALEVYRVSGKTMTEFHYLDGRANLSAATHRILQFAIAPKERSVLHQRIAVRFREMLADGFVEEVAQLRQRGDLLATMPAMRSVGYRQVWQYLDGELDYDEMVERGIIATRQLAKRQLTWLRGWPDLCWLLTDAKGELLEVDGPQTGLDKQGISPLEQILQIV